MPPEWDGYHFECIGQPRDTKLIRVTGAVAPLKTRGKSKGCHNWRKMDKTTEKTAFFTPAEHDDWLKAWEQKTGKCANCAGTGETLFRWSVANGVENKLCGKCSGTGKQPNAKSEGAEPLLAKLPLD